MNSDASRAADSSTGRPRGTQKGEDDEGRRREVPIPHFSPDHDPYRLRGAILCGRYQVGEQIGQGGMALVFRGRDLKADRTVAIKVLRPAMRERPDAVTRFLREARITSRVRHENVICVTDFGQTDDRIAFSIMEYLDGEDLGATLEREGPLPWPRVKQIALQVCEALQAVHEAGVVHRDLKPRNCFLYQSDKVDAVKILDFGIAKLAYSADDIEQDLTAEGAIFGTPEYIAPEQAKNAEDVDERADIYAVGVLLYQLLCGRPPFRSKTPMVTLAMHIYEECEPPSNLVRGLPPALEDVILRALRKNPDERYQSMVHLAAALQAIDGDSSAPSLGQVELDTKKMRHAEDRVLRAIRPGYIALGSATLVLIAAMAFTLADPSILEKREAITTTTESVLPRVFASAHGQRRGANAEGKIAVGARPGDGQMKRQPNAPAPQVLPLFIPPVPASTEEVVIIEEEDAEVTETSDGEDRSGRSKRARKSRRANKNRGKRHRGSKHGRASDESHARLPEPPGDEVPLRSILEPAVHSGNPDPDRPLPRPGPGRTFRIDPSGTPNPFLPLGQHTWREN